MISASQLSVFSAKISFAFLQSKTSSDEWFHNESVQDAARSTHRWMSSALSWYGNDNFYSPYSERQHGLLNTLVFRILLLFWRFVTITLANLWNFGNLYVDDKNLSKLTLFLTHWRFSRIHTPSIIHVPWTYPTQHPRLHLDRFSRRFCTAHGRQSIYFTIGRPFFPQNCPFAWIWTGPGVSRWAVSNWLGQ